MARRRVTTRSPARPIKNFSWAGVTGIAETALPAASKIVVASFVLSTAFDETITRIRGMLQVRASSGLTTAPQGSFGAIIVLEDAFAVGITAIPSPGDDIENDGWMMWMPWIAVNLVVSGIGTQNPAGVQLPIDSKAQRILREGSRLVFVLENSSTTDACVFTSQIRVLSRFRS